MLTARLSPQALQTPRKLALLVFTIGLTGCQIAASQGEVVDVMRASQAPTAPPDADPDACYGRHITPAIIETVTEQVMVQPPQINADGTVNYPAVYRTETRQEIVRERKELWFETPCTEAFTREFVETLQRALGARGYYRGPIDGILTRSTKKAIRAYQSDEGLDSDILSIAAARKLGLVAVERDPA